MIRRTEIDSISLLPPLPSSFGVGGLEQSISYSIFLFLFLEDFSSNFDAVFCYRKSLFHHHLIRKNKYSKMASPVSFRTRAHHYFTANVKPQSERKNTNDKMQSDWLLKLIFLIYTGLPKKFVHI